MNRYGTNPSISEKAGDPLKQELELELHCLRPSYHQKKGGNILNACEARHIMAISEMRLVGFAENA